MRKKGLAILSQPQYIYCVAGIGQAITPPKTQREQQNKVDKMNAGQSLQTVAQNIMDAKNHKRDFIAMTTAMRLTDAGRVAFKFEGQDVEFSPTEVCVDQIGERVGIPRKYAERMRTEAPELLAKNVNHWFAQKPEKRMLRTLRNGTDVARAFLSDKYRPLDNADIAERVLPKLVEMGLEIKSTAVTDTRLYIQAVNPIMQAKIAKVGDEVASGIVISNSEVGLGSLNMRHLIYTLRCTNGMIAESIVKQAHVGRKSLADVDSDEAAEFFTDETRKADDRAFWLKVGDLMKHTLSREKFDAIIARLNATTAVEMEKPTEVVEAMQDRFAWNEGETESVLKHLIKGGDVTQYGLLNAVTRTAEDLTNYDRAIEFEKMGGQIMLLKPVDFSLN